MWQIVNRTPFAAERGWVRDRDGAEVWLVAVKCTFDLLPDGTTVVSGQQPVVLRVPQYNGEEGKSSIRFDADLVLRKTTTDVIVSGAAYAPGGKPAIEAVVGIRVGPVQKVLRVVGDRVWGVLGPSAPKPFVRIPVVYERSYGGVDIRSRHPETDWDWRNPVGVGFAVSRDNAKGLPLPNFEYPDDTVNSWSDRPKPAGLGPVASHWQPRAGLAGTYDDRWMQTRQPLLPEDFDDRFFQVAPFDQQAPEFLRGGELVLLRNLTPSGELRFMLPQVQLTLETCFFDGSMEVHHPPALHTVILEPDCPRVSLVWLSALPCHFRVQKLKHTTVQIRADAAATDESMARA
jgi:hypothetical protein